MKNFTMLSAIAISLSFFTNTAQSQHQLIKKWESDSTLKIPESVYFDAGNQVLYVSNIDGKGDSIDGKGSIGKVGLDGKIVSAEWVTGLNAPKGMALVKNMLWVADMDQVVGIDIGSGQISKKVKVDGAMMLNDLAADPKGVLYVSDSKRKTVHRIENGKVSTFLENLKGPNGVLVYNKDVYVLDAGTMYKVGKGKSLEKIAEGMEGGTDGIENVEGNDFIVSCWAGVVYYVKADGTTEKLLDTRDQKYNSADIGYDAKTRMVYVPTFFRNSVVAYQLQ